MHRTPHDASRRKSAVSNDQQNDAKRTLGSDASSNVVVWQMVRKYWPTALATFVVVLLGTVFYSLGQTRIYEAAATVQFDPNPPRPLGNRVESVVEMGAGSFWGFQEYYETQYHIIRSRRVALAVVKELGLQNDDAFIHNLPKGVEPETKQGTTPEIAAEILRGRLVVESIRDSRLAEVKLRDANPERAQRILVVIVDTYIRQNLDAALESTSSATDWLRGQLDTLKKDLESSELELHHYKKDKDILSVAFDDKSSMLAEEMGQINHELTSVKAALQQAAARRAVLNSSPGNDPSLIYSTELLQSALLNSLRGEYEQALRERDALLGTGKGTNHPDVAAAQRRVDAASASILKEIKNVKRAVSQDVAVLARTAGGLESMLEKAKTQAHQLNLLEIEFNRLRRQKENTEKLFSLVLERTKEADLSQMMRVNNITVVDEPVVPRAPVLPKVPLNLAIGGFLGLFFGLAAAFLRGLMDRTVKVPGDIEELDMTFVGLLPKLSNASSAPAAYGKRRRRGKRVTSGVPELIVHEQPTSSLAEASRAIRTNLMFMSPDMPQKTLLVTSAGPSEGKTTVACSIAIALAQTGQRVALIDCDLRRPRIQRIFNVDSTLGITSALLDHDLADTVQETIVPNLFVIPSGPIPPNPAELLHTERFKALLKEAERLFDRVVIDSPPVAAVTDPTILSTIADGTILVVRAFKTRKELARHAIRSIQDVGGRLVGAVLNAVDFSRLEYKYSYYYYRRDEYYGEKPATRMTEPSSRGSQPAAPS